MKRILIGSALVALCTAVAVAQAPKSSTPSPSLIAPSVPKQTTVPAAKKGTTTTTGIVGPFDSRTPRLPNQNLSITGGSRIDAVFDRNVFKVALKDGTYKLDNGGAIRVRGGRVVWDAFGVIERIKVQGPAESVPALG